jgi:peptide deformylase
MIALVPKDHPVLSITSRHVEEDELTEAFSLGLAMIDLMASVGAIGMSANQVGFEQRVMVFRLDGQSVIAINPVILGSYGGEIEDREGSVQDSGVTRRVRRHRRVTVGFTSDTDGNWLEMSLKTKSARCYQHQLDHLNGICIWHPNIVTG